MIRNQVYYRHLLLNILVNISFVILALYYFLRFLTWIIVIRIIMSWVAPASQNIIARFIVETSEQILNPIRRILPRGQGMMGMVDWSPLVALILIDLLSYWLITTFG